MRRTLKLTTYPDKRGALRWRVVAGNGRVVARSPRSYPRDAVAIGSDIRFLTGAPHDAQLYRDKRGEWRWRLRRDERIVAVSSEGYKNRGDCVAASDLFLDATPA